MDKQLCPICGGVLFRPCALQDGSICGDCADELRFAYPMIYLPRVGMLEDHPQCRDLRQKDITYLKKHREETTVYSAGRDRRIYRFDPMSLLSLEDFTLQLPSADARENWIRQDYEDYTNVLTVDYCRPLLRPVGKKGIQNLRRLKRGYAVTGFIRTGCFRDGDMVWIRQKDRLWYADILALDYEKLTVDPDCGELRTRYAEALGNQGEQGRAIRAGYQVTLVLSEKAAGIQAGDWIVSD